MHCTLVFCAYLMKQDYVSRVFVLVWQLAQPFLFALIGAEINFSVIRPSFVGELIASVLVIYTTAL